MIAKSVSIFLWSFLVGLTIANIIALPMPVVICLVVLGLLALGLTTVGVANFARGVIGFFAFCLLGLSLGNLLWVNSIQVNEYEQFAGQKVYTEGTVTAWPKVTSSGNQALLIKPDGYSQALRASLRQPIKVKPGDRVWIRGEIKQPENFSEFNYVYYLKKSNVYAELDKAKIAVTERRSSRFNNLLNGLRSWIINKAFLRLNTASANLVLGTLIGYSDSLPKIMEEAFKKSGLTHILVASGFNLTIIAGSVGFFGWVIGRRASDAASIGLVWFFVALTGGSGSVVRAGVMTTLVLVGRAFGRMPSSYHTLLLAVVVMAGFNPLQLFYDIGFQLSVGATIGVLEANKLRLHLQKEGWLIELLWPTVGAIIATTPIITMYFGTLSVIAPVANLLVLPLIEFVMLFGALSILPAIHIFTVPLTELIVAYQMKVTLALSSWQYSSINFKSSLGFLIGYYVLLVLIRESFYFRSYNMRVSSQKSQKTELKNTELSDKITKIII